MSLPMYILCTEPLQEAEQKAQQAKAEVVNAQNKVSQLDRDKKYYKTKY